jgi:hypothetical protein
MDILKEKYGAVVPNDGVSLTRELGVTDLWHAGKFQFGAKLWGVEVDIATEPVGEEAEEIRILSVRMSDKDLYKQGIYTKIGITYRMQRGNETAESFINLPVSRERYMELAQGLKPDSEAWRSIQEALQALTVLQNYDELGSWSIELKIETDGEVADDD